MLAMGMVKSKLFQRLDDAQHARMREDFSTVLPLSDEKLAEIVSRIPALRTSNRRSFEEILEKFRADFSDIQVDRIVPLLLWFSRYATEPQFLDSSESWVDDMIELGIAPEDQRDRCNAIVNHIRAEFTAEQTKLKLSRQRAEDGLLPRFVDADMTVELRAMFDKDFSAGSEPLTAYSPSVAGLVPILTLQVELDGGEPDRFYIQLTHEDLKDFISILSAADRQLEVITTVSQSLNNGKEG